MKKVTVGFVVQDFNDKGNAPPKISSQETKLTGKMNMATL